MGVPSALHGSGVRMETTHTSVMVGGRRFDLNSRYTILSPIGEGANGFVISARDEVIKQEVAIKRLANPFMNELEARRTLREIKLLKYFKHENVLRVTDILPPLSRGHLEDVYIATELMDTDLAQVISGGHELDPEQLQYIMYQVMRGLLHIHSANVIHRDIKPSNLLINSECDLKICDFGMARVARAGNTEETQYNPMTEYVATRWYRAPEIMLSWQEYTSAVDVWSVGCVFAELLLLKPLFAGRDYLHQLELITSVRGTPPDLQGIASQHALAYMQRLPHSEKANLADMFPSAAPVLVDLLDHMLAFLPEERTAVADALKHPYFESLHDPSDEPTTDELFSWDFEETAMSCEELKQLFWEELTEMHPEIEFGSPVEVPEIMPQAAEAQLI